MNYDRLKTFTGKRILLLQGPVGPFFSRLADDLIDAGAEVSKICFNGGDLLFSKHKPILFRQNLNHWPDFFERVLKQQSIDMVFLFGDCRPIHRVARRIANKQGVVVGVFEEGYIRPDYITLEEFGVNGYSTLPSLPDFYIETPVIHAQPTFPVGNTFNDAALWSTMYYITSILAKPLFPHYQHHRPLAVSEALPWIKALWRKNYYATKEQGVLKQLTTTLSGKYFLVPLQVYNDGQIRVHSKYRSVTEFIQETIESFAIFAPTETHLVLKHHPLDRGYNDYSELISKMSEQLNISNRVLYVHDLHLPTMLQHAQGVVVINSTVGLSAIHHGRPTKTCGKAIYDMKGLTSQNSLDAFWETASSEVPNNELYLRFRDYIIEHCQLNGSFYKRIANSQSKTGIVWRTIRSKFHEHSLKKANNSQKQAALSSLSLIAETIRSEAYSAY